MSALTDSLGRRMRKLRVSLTEACNLGCFYCMPAQPSFASPIELLAPEEYGAICGTLVSLGIEELRLTGGEPTVRPEFRTIVSVLAALPVRLSMTSNGMLLEKHLSFLHECDLRRLNISVDSLDAGVFERMTHGGDLPTVLRCVDKARGLGFHVKINAVIFRGINDGELDEFAQWSAAEGIEVRFLEFMNIGPARAENRKRFIPAREMIDRLSRQRDLQPVPVPEDATSFVFETAEGARLGFMASESQPFCGSCSRLRLSAKGTLRSCLMSEAGVGLRHVAPADYPELVRRALAMKPMGRIDHVDQPMHAIGG